VQLACNGLERGAGHRLARELVELALLGEVGTAANSLRASSRASRAAFKDTRTKGEPASV